MPVCVYVCLIVHVGMFVWLCACCRVCSYVCMTVCLYACMFVYVYHCMYVCV